MHINSPSHSPFLAQDTERSDGESFRTAHGSMRADGNSVPSNGESFRTTHGSFRSEVSVVVGVEDPANSPNAHALRDKLTKFFEPHVTEQNREAFTQLIEQRATRLNEMGETPESVEATLAKGQKLDRVSQGVVGALKSVPFGAASRLLDTVPALTAFAPTTALVGLTAGVISGAADVIGGGVLKRATSDTQWLTAKPEELETVMADAAKAREPSLKQSTLEAGVAFQTFSIRNTLRLGAATIGAETMTKPAAQEMDSWLSAAGSPASGSAAYLALQAMSERNHRTGPEYLLGRQDWEAQYTTLKDVNPLKDPLIYGAKRLAHIPVDMATDGLEATRKFFTATSLVQNVGMLGGGIAGTLAAKEAVEKAAVRAGFSEPAVAAAGHAVNTVLSAPVYAAWTTASVLTGPATDKAANFLQENSSSLLNQAANYLQGRPSGLQPVPSDDIALDNMEAGIPQQGTTGNGQPLVASQGQNRLEIMTEEPPATAAAGAPSTSASGQGEVAMVQVASTPPNNAERNV